LGNESGGEDATPYIPSNTSNRNTGKGGRKKTVTISENHIIEHKTATEKEHTDNPTDAESTPISSKATPTQIRPSTRGGSKKKAAG
jgi:hypothetical protein